MLSYLAHVYSIILVSCVTQPVFCLVVYDPVYTAIVHVLWTNQLQRNLIYHVPFFCTTCIILVVISTF